MPSSGTLVSPTGVPDRSALLFFGLDIRVTFDEANIPGGTRAMKWRPKALRLVALSGHAAPHPFARLAGRAQVKVVDATMREPIDPHLRSGESLDEEADLVVRGWPLTVEGLLANAAQAMERFSWRGVPLIAVSAEATVAGRTLDDVLSGPRLRTRKRYAMASAGVLSAGFDLLPTFGVPHYSVVLRAYTEDEAKHLLDALGQVHRNPHYVGRT